MENNEHNPTLRGPGTAPNESVGLSAERLAEIRELQGNWKSWADERSWRAASNTPHLATSYAGELLAELDRVTAMLKAAEAALQQQRAGSSS